VTALVLLVFAAASFVLLAVGANLALHWTRARPQMSGQRRIPPRLTPRAVFDEAGATVLALFGPAAALLPPPKPLRPARPTRLALLRDPRLPANAHWLLRRRLERAGWHVTASLPTGSPTDANAVDRIAAAITAAVGSGGPITLVGVGQSGLLARQLAARHRHFPRVLTIATPHQGTTSPAMSAAVRPPSDYLEAVAVMDERPRAFDAIAIYSNGDGWLEPTDASYYPGAFNLEVHDVGHLSMLFSARVFHYVEENLEAPLPADLGR